MNKVWPVLPPDVLLGVLCKYFRIDPKVVTYMEQIEMFYIYHYIVDKFQTNDPEIVFGEIKKLQSAYRMRSKRKRLYNVFFQCKVATMTSSNRYDTTAARVPTKPFRANYY